MAELLDEEIIKSLKKLHEFMLVSGQTLGAAESCTGGLLSAHITSLPGASKYFYGSVVSYHRSIKENLIQVPSEEINKFGEVSNSVARHMALGSKKVLNVDWSVSITGIAGPGGGSAEKPVGTVCFAVSGPDIEVVHQELFKSEERRKIQLESVKFAIDFLWDSIKNKGGQ